MMPMDKNEQRHNLGLVVAKALRDDTFKAAFKENPRAILEKFGVYPPEGVEILVVENTPSRIYLTLPSLPLPTVPSYEDMEAIETRKGSFAAATPKDKGCCGGASSVAAIWLEDDGDESAADVTILGEVLTTT